MNNQNKDMVETNIFPFFLKKKKKKGKKQKQK